MALKDLPAMVESLVRVTVRKMWSDDLSERDGVEGVKRSQR